MSGGATLPLGIDVGTASSKALFAALARRVAHEPDLEPEPAMAPGYDERNLAARESSPSAWAPEGV